VDELTSKYEMLRADHVELMCSCEKVMYSHIMLMVAHEVVTILVTSSPLDSH
jgi:hypothetical protein